MMQHNTIKTKSVVLLYCTLIALAVLDCGTARADLVYVNNDGMLTQIVGAQGTAKDINISGSDVFSFTHNGQPRLLVTTLEGDIMVFDPENMSEPLSSGNIAILSGITLFKTDSVAEFGSNIAVTLKDCHSLLIINPETCRLVDTYTEGESSYMSVVYPYSGQIIIFMDVPYQDENGSVRASGGSTNIITMDSSGTITGRLDNFAFNGQLETSGGELYFALGGSEYVSSSERAEYQGIYRVSRMLGNMNVANAVRVTSDNPHRMARDGSRGLYYTAFGSYSGNSTPRYIYHWDGLSSTQVYDAGSGYTIDNIQYDIKNRVLYAEIIDSSYTINLTALTAGSDGKFSSSQSFGEHIFTVMGNPADSSSGGSVIPDTPSDTPAQTTELSTGVIEPAPALSSSVIDNLAALVSIDSSALHLITQENISTPSEPTQTMREYMQSDGYEPAYKLNTLTVNEDGYYVFMVNIPDEFVGKKVSNIKIYALKNADFASAFYGLINGVLNYGEITNLFGVKIDTLEKQVLAVGILQAGTPFSVYLAKIILALLAGGCSLTGTGTLIFCAVCLAGIFFVKR